MPWPPGHRDAEDDDAPACGVCESMENEDANGIGWCRQYWCTTECDFVCDTYKRRAIVVAENSK